MKRLSIKLFSLLLPLFLFLSLSTKPVFADCVTNIQCQININTPGCSLVNNLPTCKNTIPEQVGNAVNSFVNQGDQIPVSCENDPNSINTALGCISYSDQGHGFVSTLITMSIGFGGAIALILILYGFYILTTSAGMPDKVKAGKEIITSAIGGLLFIIMSAALLNLLGVQILGLPGF